MIITQNNDYSNYINNIGISEQLITGRNFYYIAFSKKLKEEEKKQIKNLINREQIIYEIYNKKYAVADFPLQYGSFLNNTVQITGQGIDKLETSNPLILGVPQDEELYKIAELIKRQLEEAKIETNIIYYSSYENAIENDYFDLVLNKRKVEITPKIDYYFLDENTKNNIRNIYKIENKEVLKEQYNKIIEIYNKEIPFIGLFFNSYIILHNDNLKGNFAGNWYNIFYNIDTWYKVE